MRNGAAEKQVCATLRHHYQWKCTYTVSLRDGESLSMHVDVSQLVSQWMLIVISTE